MSRRVKIAFMAVSIAMAIGWIGFGSSIAGIYRFMEAGLPESAMLESCPWSQLHYRFEGDVLTHLVCVGGGLG